MKNLSLLSLLVALLCQSMGVYSLSDEGAATVRQEASDLNDQKMRLLRTTTTAGRRRVQTTGKGKGSKAPTTKKPKKTMSPNAKSKSPKGSKAPAASSKAPAAESKAPSTKKPTRSMAPSAKAPSRRL